MSERHEGASHQPVDPAVTMVEQFVAEEFLKNPHYSFNDWTVMRDHSYRVRDLALQINQEAQADSVVVALGALLHDIGKTHHADPETLHHQHEDFNLLVSEPLLDSLGLRADQLEKLKAIIQHKSDSLEMKIVEDADAIAFYADKRLYTLFINWARENRLDDATQRKINKFDKLHFERSKQLAKPWLEQMKRDWGVT